MRYGLRASVGFEVFNQVLTRGLFLSYEQMRVSWIDLSPRLSYILLLSNAEGMPNIHWQRYRDLASLFRCLSSCEQVKHCYRSFRPLHECGSP